MARAKPIVLLTLATLMGCAATPQPGVAPWDFPDRPNPYPGAPAGAPPARTPTGMVRGTGPSATTSNGYTVTLVSIARKLPEGGKEVTPDALAVWRPDGSPALAAPPNNTFGGNAALIDHGARLLTFEVKGPGRSTDASVMGYVPEGAREDTPTPEFHGWDRSPFSRLWNPNYSTWVVVDDRKASHYRFAIADGPWKTVASGVLPAYRRQTETILTGPWGRVRHIVIPMPSVRFRWTLEDEYGRYVAEPSSLVPDEELRVRFLTRSATGPGSLMYAKGTPFIVEARPWHWVELSGIHYDPDPVKWPKGGLWGDEGKPLMQRADGVALEALASFEKDRFGGWSPTTIYAPDGQRWRNHPDAQALLARISGGSLPANSMLALLRFDQGRVSQETPARVEVFAASSDVPGKGLGERVSYFKEGTYPQEVAHIPFTRPKTPFVQFAVRYGGDDWTPVGEVPIPKMRMPMLTPEDRAKYAQGNVYNNVFSAILRFYPDRAHLDLHLSPEEPNRLRQDLLKWPLDAEARIVARLKSGKRIPLSFNASGTSGDGSTSREAGFDLTADGDARYRDTLGKTSVLLSQVAAIGVETRKYAEPLYLVAKLP